MNIVDLDIVLSVERCIVTLENQFSRWFQSFFENLPHASVLSAPSIVYIRYDTKKGLNIMNPRLNALKSILTHAKCFYRESFTKDNGKYFKIHAFNARYAKTALETTCAQYHISESLKARIMAYAWENA